MYCISSVIAVETSCGMCQYKASIRIIEAFLTDVFCIGRITQGFGQYHVHGDPKAMTVGYFPGPVRKKFTLFRKQGVFSVCKYMINFEPCKSFFPDVCFDFIWIVVRSDYHQCSRLWTSPNLFMQKTVCLTAIQMFYRKRKVKTVVVSCPPHPLIKTAFHLIVSNP